jgi:hypothetical protein
MTSGPRLRREVARDVATWVTFRTWLAKDVTLH